MQKFFVVHLNLCISAHKPMGSPKAQHFFWRLPGGGGAPGNFTWAEDSSSILPLNWGLLGHGNERGFSSLGDSLEDDLIS